MEVLPDLIEPDLTTLFCGSAASSASARYEAYYAGPGNRFWLVLQETGLTPRLFAPPEFPRLSALGIGLTDLAKNETGADRDFSTSSYDCSGLRKKIDKASPAIIAFTGKRPASIFLMRSLGIGTEDYGEQSARLGQTRIFVLPSPSGAARRWWSPEPWHSLAATHREIRDMI
ncbi:MAG: mismatch-specific DNA-glycosylase [Pseudomonadota bacterium]|nr:mismatch-specific DNA-glycosylase [Pseudomonadota bacterium]